MNKKWLAPIMISAALVALVAGCDSPLLLTAPTVAEPSPVQQSPASQAVSPQTSVVPVAPSVVSPTPVSTAPSQAVPDVNPPIVNGTIVVTISIGFFTPSVIWIPAGTTVEWQTEDHLSTHAIDGEDYARWGFVVYWQPLRVQFNTPGTYRYCDDADPSVKGTIIVF